MTPMTTSTSHGRPVFRGALLALLLAGCGGPVFESAHPTEDRSSVAPSSSAREPPADSAPAAGAGGSLEDAQATPGGARGLAEGSGGAGSSTGGLGGSAGLGVGGLDQVAGGSGSSTGGVTGEAGGNTAEGGAVVTGGAGGAGGLPAASGGSPQAGGNVGAGGAPPTNCGKPGHAGVPQPGDPNCNANTACDPADVACLAELRGCAWADRFGNDCMSADASLEWEWRCPTAAPALPGCAAGRNVPADLTYTSWCCPLTSAPPVVP